MSTVYKLQGFCGLISLTYKYSVGHPSSRAYEANVTTAETTKGMISAALRIQEYK